MAEIAAGAGDRGTSASCEVKCESQVSRAADLGHLVFESIGFFVPTLNWLYGQFRMGTHSVDRVEFRGVNAPELYGTITDA